MNTMSPREMEQVSEDGGIPLKEALRSQLEQAALELREVNLMVEQSELEVKRLVQRNTAVTSNLHQVYAQFESLPRTDIRTAYESALDAQQRLFLMRGHLEKMQSDQAHLERFIAALEQSLQVVEDLPEKEASANVPSARAEVLEMLIEAQETERKRLSRQMHDGPAQALSNFILQTEISMRLFELDKAKALEELAVLKNTATETFQKVRDFIFQLRPMMLDDLGLLPTVERYVAAFKEQSGVDMKLVLTGAQRRLEPFLEVMIFRTIQELVNTAVNQNQATQVNLQVDMTESSVRVGVEDNSPGPVTNSLDKEEGQALHLIKERVEMLGGRFDIDNQSGQGTFISFQVPSGSRPEI
jgi:two-component system, NarL family, sensor histidine kinase DegS